MFLKNKWTIEARVTSKKYKEKLFIEKKGFKGLIIEFKKRLTNLFILQLYVDVKEEENLTDVIHFLNRIKEKNK